jgi:sec-independent protein translocase protein TatA
MHGFGWQELLIILVIVVIIFGGTKIAGVGKASGRAIREFKDELKGPDGETQQQAAPPAVSGPTQYPADPGSGFQTDPANPAPQTPPGQPDLR